MSHPSNGPNHADISDVGLTGYAICTSPRSGSNFLCQILSSTDQLGYPLEYFNGPARRTLTDPAYPDDPLAQAKWVLTKGATPNRVYALKLFAYQHDMIAPQLRWTQTLPNLRFVHLTRRHLLAQAISWAIAIQTEQYRWSQQRKAEPHYNAALITKCLHDIAREQARWQLFFARNGIEPLSLVYEDFMDAPHLAVERIAAMLNLTQPPQIKADRIDLKKQRTTLNEDMQRRYISEHGDRDFIDHLNDPAAASINRNNRRPGKKLMLFFKNRSKLPP